MDTAYTFETSELSPSLLSPGESPIQTIHALSPSYRLRHIHLVMREAERESFISHLLMPNNTLDAYELFAEQVR